MSNLLEGIKVVELGTHIAIPKATRMMADWGAEVIKIEAPQGEAWRTIARSYGVPFEADNNPIFQTPNANKKSIAIDLKTDEGKEILFKLLGQADMFLTNTRLKSLKKMGIDYNSLKTRFPKLIYAHFTGYGSQGPDKDRPGFDIAAYWARAGMPIEWTTQENAPFRPMPGFGDSTVSAIVLSGVLAALFNRQRTGEGEYLQTSLYGCALWFNSCGVVVSQPQYGFTYPRSRYDQTAPYNPMFKSKDNVHFFFSIPNWNNVYQNLLKMIHLEQYIGDERFAKLENARDHMAEIIKTLEEAFGNMNMDEIGDGFQRLDIVFDVPTNPSNVTKDEQAWANGYLQKIKLENGAEVVIPSNPLQFERARTTAFHLAPQLGADTVTVLTSLGYNSAQIQQIIDKKIVVKKES